MKVSQAKDSDQTIPTFDHGFTIATSPANRRIDGRVLFVRPLPPLLIAWFLPHESKTPWWPRQVGRQAVSVSGRVSGVYTFTYSLSAYGREENVITIYVVKREPMLTDSTATGSTRLSSIPHHDSRLYVQCIIIPSPPSPSPSREQYTNHLSPQTQCVRCLHTPLSGERENKKNTRLRPPASVTKRGI